MAKFKIKSGDTVKVIAGANKGSEGRVQRGLAKSERVIGEGVNMVSKHQKPSATNPQGGIVQVEAPIHISNLMLVDPKSGEPTRVGRRVEENGDIVRYAKNSKEIIK